MRKTRLLCFALTLAFGAAGQEGYLRILVLEGEGAFNNIKRNIGRNILVEVRNERGEPVPGAHVVFTAPALGPGVRFGNGTSKYSTKTDDQGRASADVKPNQAEGRFVIKIVASGGVRQGSVTVAQSNTLAGGYVPSVEAGKSRKKLVWIGLIGGSAAGAFFALGRGNGGSDGRTAPPRSTVLSVGAVTVGGPR